jgi:hypothetical protein
VSEEDLAFETLMRTNMANNPDAANPAIAFPFHAGRRRRLVADPDR